MITAIGSIGGSGTRVVAQILNQIGYSIGHDLNRSLDNLVFTRLFKDPKWYLKATLEDISFRLKIFEKISKGKLLKIDEFYEYFRASFNNNIQKTSFKKHLSSLRVQLFNSEETQNWGWKEPNSSIYIESLASYFRELKYIHVIRHGLDMAFSRNVQQLVNWGFLFDIDILDSNRISPIKQLKYWIALNKFVIEKGSVLFDKRFYILDFDVLCINKEAEVKKLLNFLEIDWIQKDVDQICNFIKMPESRGRYKNKNLNIFPKEDLNRVKEFGYLI